MTDADVPYPATPVLVASERRVAPSVLPATCFAVIAVLSLVTAGIVAAVLCAIGAIAFAIAARRELQADEALVGTRRSLLAMIVGSVVLTVLTLTVILPLFMGSFFWMLG